MKCHLKMINEEKTLMNNTFDATGIEDAWKKAKDTAKCFMDDKGFEMVEKFEKDYRISAILKEEKEIEIEQENGDVPIFFRLKLSDEQKEKVLTTEDWLIDRLDNWKFESALKYTEGQPKPIVETIETLSRMFGNCGSFQGDMSTLVWHTVNDIKNRILNKEESKKAS